MGLFGPPDVEKMKIKNNSKGLIQALNHKKEWIQVDAAIALGEIGSKEAVNPLINALNNQGRRVRQAAAESLGEISALEAVEPLIAALTDKVSHVRNSAIKSLSIIGDTRAIEPIASTLKDRDGFIRVAAADALADIGDSRAFEPLIECLKSTFTTNEKLINVRKAVVIALEKLGWQPDTGENGAYYYVATNNLEMATKLGGTAIQPLVYALRENDEDLSSAVAESLEKVGWKPDQDEDGVLFWIAKGNWDKATSLGPISIDPLIEACQNHNVDAVKALGEIGDRRAVDQLIAMLKIDYFSSDYLCVVVNTLGKIGSEKSVEPLLQMLSDSMCSFELHEAIAEALGEIGDSRAVKPLIVTLKEMNHSTWTGLSNAAASALVKLYHKGSLNEGDKKIILSARKYITESHIDYDTTCQTHHDYGTGVDFPL